MKILHCCLANIYVDNFSYQENILPIEHKRAGYDVEILASTETYIDNKKLGYVEATSYFTEDGIKITRLPYMNFPNKVVVRKLRIYKGIIQSLENIKPNIIFIHGSQFLGIQEIVKYAKKNRDIKIYVDGHADYINSAKNWFSKNFLHRFIYRYSTLLINPYTDKFYGVLPARVDFLVNMYKVPKEKVELLVMGADTEKINFANQENIKIRIRKKLKIADKDFVIITGGKIDERKKIQNLMKAVSNLDLDNIKLIVFGTCTDEMSEIIKSLSSDPKIKLVGWLNPNEVYDYFLTSDLAFFPGTHSVLWEQAVGTGMPCVFREWNGIKHVDLDGNCLFIRNSEVDEIESVLRRIINDPSLYESLRNIAIKKGIEAFSYKKIAAKSIEKG